MRILIVTGIFPPDIGGPAKYVPEVARALRVAGHDVRVISLSDDPKITPADVDYPVTLIHRRMPRLLRFVKVVISVARYARDSDVVYVNGLALEAYVGCRLVGAKYLQKIVGDTAWERARNRGWYQGTLVDYQKCRKATRLKCLDLIRSIPVRYASQIIVPSNFLKAIVAEWRVDQRRIEVIYNGVPIPPTQPPPLCTRDPSLVVTVSRLVPWKHLDQVIVAISRTTSARLVIYGDGPMMDSLRRCANEFRVADRVKFMGACSNAVVRAGLQSASLFVLNSSYEGLPHVVLEAMAQGTPVIATDAGGTREVVVSGVTGMLLPSGATASLASGINQLLLNLTLRERFAIAGRELVESHFSSEGMLAATTKALVAAGQQH